jgi:hypothetical protein
MGEAAASALVVGKATLHGPPAYWGARLIAVTLLGVPAHWTRRVYTDGKPRGVVQ